LRPFLGGELLNIEMTSATNGVAVVCDEDGTGIIFINEGRFGDGKKVETKFPDALDVLPATTASHSTATICG
jgi:hypothetical protein